MADDLGAVVETDRRTFALWPEGPPATPFEAGEEQVYEGVDASGRATPMLRNVSEPTITAYAPAPGAANGVGVIVCPGGGWRILANQHEGTEVAEALAARGYTAFLLKYRLLPTAGDPRQFAEEAAALAATVAAKRPGATAPRSLADISDADPIRLGRAMAAEDGRRALALVRQRAADFGVDPARVGIMGFSAGAFLALDVALDPGGDPVAFVAPIYGGDIAGRTVGPQAPPHFTAVAQDDTLFFRMVETTHGAWCDADRPSELHVFTRGSHGFGMAPMGLPVVRWWDLFLAWLDDLRAADRGDTAD